MTATEEVWLPRDVHNNDRGTTCQNDGECQCWRGSLSIDLLVRKNLRWTGHLMRMSPDNLPKQVLYSQLSSGHRKRGRPHLWFKDTIKRNLKPRDRLMDITFTAERPSDRQQMFAIHVSQSGLIRQKSIRASREGSHHRNGKWFTAQKKSL